MRPALLLALGVLAGCADDQKSQLVNPTETPSPNLSVATLSSLSISPATANVALGGTLQFTASAQWSDGSSLLPKVYWLTNGGAMTTGGYYMAPKMAGTYRVIAWDGSLQKSDTSFVTVGSSSVSTSLTKLQVSPDPFTLQPGQTRQFSAVATYSNGTTGTPTVTWTSTGGTISSSGLYTAGSTTGTFRVIAQAATGTVKDTSTVKIAKVTKLTMTPSSATVAKGATQQFATTATWSDGVNRSVTLSYSATGGTISSSGAYTAGTTAGTFRVIVGCANSACTAKDTSTVTIPTTTSPTTGTTLTISPQTRTLDVGEVYKFSVTAKFSNGTTSTNPTVTWSANGGLVSSSGWYRAPREAGTYTVTAKYSDGASASASVTVRVPTGPYFTDNFDSCTLNKTVNAYGFAWTHTGGSLSAEIPGVTRAKPRSGTCSLRFTFVGNTNLSDDSWSEQRFMFGKRLSEVWIQWYQYFPNGTEGLGARWYHRDALGPDNNKLLRLWDDDYMNYNIKAGFSTLPAGGDSQLNTEYLYHTSDGVGHAVSNIGPWTRIANSSTRGTWVKFKAHARVASSSTAKDGVIQFWMNDVMIANFTTLPLYSALTGGKNYFRNGYLMGWSNSGFNSTTNTYIDDVIISGVPIP